MKKMNIVYFSFIIIIAIFLVWPVLVKADHTDNTFVGGASSHPDSDVVMALSDGGYCYSPLMLTIGSIYNCTFEIYINETLYTSGKIDVTVRGFKDIQIEFEKGGEQPFAVVVGQDTYNYTLKVLKRSFEAVITEQVIEELDLTLYTFNDVMKAYGSSVVGVLVAVIVAYIFKIPKLKSEPRRLL